MQLNSFSKALLVMDLIELILFFLCKDFCFQISVLDIEFCESCVKQIWLFDKNLLITDVEKHKDINSIDKNLQTPNAFPLTIGILLDLFNFFNSIFFFKNLSDRFHHFRATHCKI